MTEPHPELARLRAAHRRVHRPDPALRERVARAVADDRRREDAWRWIGASLVSAVLGVAALLVMHWVAVGVATLGASERSHDAAKYDRAHDDQPRPTETHRGAVTGAPAPSPATAAPLDPTAPLVPSPSPSSSVVDGAPAEPTPSTSKRPPSTGSSGADRAGTSSTDLTAEVRLLREAEVALSTDPARALEQLRAHAEQFPRTSLPLERRALRILALCGSSPDPAATRERDAFLREHPTSPYAARVRSACRG